MKQSSYTVLLEGLMLAITNQDTQMIANAISGADTDCLMRNVDKQLLLPYQEKINGVKGTVIRMNN